MRTLRNRSRGAAVVCERLLVAAGFFERARGLLGRDRLEEGSGLWLEPCSSIHMFFMRFAIDAVFVGAGGAVAKVVPDLRPWSIAACPGARACLELPAGATGRDATGRARIAPGDVLEIH